MKKILRTLVVLILVGGSTAHAQLTSQTAGSTRLMVRLQENLRAELQRNQPGEAGPAAKRFEQLNREHGAQEVQALNPAQSTNGRAQPPAMYLIALPAGINEQQAIRDYEQSGLFQYVELDAQGQGGGTLGVVPNDGQYGRQWYLKNNGTFSLAAARAGADIKMEDAWAITQGDSSVTVAIIDSGCKLDHPEFAGRIWRKRQEIANNGIDDDTNGFVDDVSGWNFVARTNSPLDDIGHGTNVASIIGATGNNGIGYAGVNWNCKLMICKALDSQNQGFYSWWVSSIYYAVSKGARVINMSLGGTAASQSMQDAVTYATQQGVVVVACVMNNNNSVVNYPAGLTGVIGVGATNPDNSRANPFFWSATSGSNYGPHISLVAPGNYVYGLNHQSNTNYNTYWGGTSQATPLVVGVVSLMLTLRPLLTPAQVKSILQTTADDRVGSAAEDVVGWDQYFGYGRLNAARALTTTVTASRAAQPAVAGFQLFPNPGHDLVTLRVTDTRLLQHEVHVFNNLGQLVSRQLLAGLTQQLPVRLAVGTYWVAVEGTPGGQRLVVE